MGNSINMQFIAKTAPAIAILGGILLILIDGYVDQSTSFLGFIIILIGAFLYSLPYIPKIIDALNK